MPKPRRMKLKLLIALALSVLIVLGTAGYTFYLNKSQNGYDYRAVKGFLDLSNWEPDREKIIQLDGKWEFYPGILLEPGLAQEYNSELIDVPSSWNSFLNNHGSSECVGSYRFLIQLPEDGAYGLKIRTIRLASKVFLNGQQISSTGQIALDRAEFEPESKFQVGGASSVAKQLELIIQVANYGYRAGGILKSIEFGTLDAILHKDNLDGALDAFAVSVCLILGVYFLVIYFQRRKETFLFFFSLANIGMALYLSIMDEQLLNLIFDYSFATRLRLQILSLILVSVALLQFTALFFEQYTNKKSIKIITFINIFFLLNLLMDPTGFSPLLATIYQVSVALLYFITYIAILIILIKAIIHEATSWEYILLIISAFISYWLLITLKIIFEIDLGNIQVLLMLLLFMSVAALMSHRLQLDYQEVNALTEKLIRQDGQKDEFLGRAAHELKTPLHIILNLTKRLVEGKQGTINAQQQENLLFVYQEGQRLTRLVNDLLDASQIKTGETKFRPQSFSPYQIVADILVEMASLIPPANKVSLRNAIPEDMPHIMADPDKFIQIIYNLVHNSLKYTGQGEIVVTGDIKNGQAEIKVADTGTGIQEKFQHEIFDLFFQDNENNSTTPGFGLGLSIVKHLVESQGGQIELTSEYGVGSEFRFTMPIAQQGIMEAKDALYPRVQTRELPTYKKTKSFSGKQPLVLVVDDEPLNQKILIDLLLDMDCDYQVAATGTEALNMVEEEKPDLVILDFMLPDLDGSKVCARIRQKYSMVDLPILILTAAGSNIDLTRAFEYGANDFQRKPIEAEELASRIISLLTIKKVVDQSLDKELKYYQAQISPHFLYNTMNTIIGLTYQDNEKVRQALNNLAVYFRAKLNLHREAKPLVSLESELELIKAYLEIEEMRYGDRLHLVYDIEDDLEGRIPPLTLQPLVENAVYHGLKSSSEELHIRIAAQKQDKNIIILIEDNGVGMDAQKQQELLQGTSKGLGFKNVLKRIKLLKGAELFLDSSVGQGTKIKIIIPGVIADESNLSR